MKTFTHSLYCHRKMNEEPRKERESKTFNTVNKTVANFTIVMKYRENLQWDDMIYD